MHKIYLENCRFKSHHGVFDEEKVIGGEFVVDLVLTTDFTDSMTSDRIEGTVNYADVYNLLSIEMKKSSNLLEHLASRIIDSIFGYSRSILNVQIKICKTHPPIQGEIGAVCVEIQKSR